MNKLFRKIECKDRLPDKDGLYTTDKGEAYFYGRTGHFNIWESPVYWYEPVEIPTDEEIVNISNEEIILEHPNIIKKHEVGYKLGFYSGFEAAINHLTGGK